MSGKKALVIVDVQNDFCEGGALAVSGGAAVAAAIARRLEAAGSGYDLVVATRDWHQDPGPHFSDAPDFVDSWPPHCVAGSPGAELRPEIRDLPAVVFDKGRSSAAYSGFEGCDAGGDTLEQALRKEGIEALEVVGIATDYCVRATALDARRAGFGVRVLEDLCAAVNPQTGEGALEEMRAAGCEVVAGGRSQEDFLAAHDPSRYPPIAVTVDMVLFSIRQGRFSVLLVRRASHPDLGKWALPGGFVQPTEDLVEAAARELREETGMPELPQGMHLEQLRSYGTPGRDPRMRVVSVAYVAFVPDLPTPKAGSDADLARFWTVAEVLGPGGPELAFDHSRIIQDGVERARAKIEYTTLAAAFLEEPFTLSELRGIYEEVWGVRQDPSNFRRKVLRLEDFVLPVGDITPAKGPQGGRPADLYRRGDAQTLWPPLRRHDDEQDGEEE